MKQKFDREADAVVRRDTRCSAYCQGRGEQLDRRSARKISAVQ